MMHEGVQASPPLFTPLCACRMDKNHTSNSAFKPDNYSEEFKSPWQPDGWLKNIRGHACYNPDKVIMGGGLG